MILSYNVVETSSLSSDESNEEEKESKSYILKEKPNECRSTSIELRSSREDDFRITAPSNNKTLQKKSRDQNTSSSNLSKLSGKEEDYIQKDVLSMLNKSINKRTQEAKHETETTFSNYPEFNIFPVEEYESDNSFQENFAENLRITEGKEVKHKHVQEKMPLKRKLNTNLLTEYKNVYSSQQPNIYNMFPAFGDFSDIRQVQDQFDVNEWQASIPQIPKKSKMKSIHNYLDMTMEELLKNCHIICKDQAGCRFLQKKIDAEPSIANDVIYFAIKDKIADLMYDGYGNYFVQKLIDNINEDKLEQILKTISPHFLCLGLDPHGTRVLQNIIQNIKSDSVLLYFTQLLIPHMLELIKDANGNHILIKYASTIPFPRNCIIFEFLNCNIVDIATHKHSCCALQKCLVVASDLQRSLLFNSIAAKTYLLISDPFGNYVIQLVVTYADYETNAKIVQAFLPNIGYLSKQKFPSNVIEKCFDYCNENTKFLIVKELCNPKILQDLLLDTYGNYVLQKILVCAIEPCRSIILQSITLHHEKLKNSNFGPKLYSKLLLLYPELNNYLCHQDTSKEQISKKAKKKSSLSRKNKAKNCVQKMSLVNNNYGYTNTQQSMNIFPCISTSSLWPNLSPYSFMNNMNLNMPIQNNIPQNKQAKSKNYYSNNFVRNSIY